MPFGAFFGATARRFTALSKARHERTGAHITELSDGSFELVALEAERCKISGFPHTVT
jgi:hypothetical protein